MLPTGESLGGLVPRKAKPPGLPQVGSFGAPMFSWNPAPVQQMRGNPYAGLLDNYMSQFRADSTAQSRADAAGRDAAIKRYLVSYGAIPDFAQMGLSDAARGVLGGLTDQVRDLAARNTAEGTSIKARMDEANAKAQRLIPAQNAARGILRSGQTGADLNQQAMDAKRGQFDVLNEMLGNIEGRVSDFAQAEAARQRALADAELQARMNAMQDWGGDINQGDGVNYDGVGQAINNFINSRIPTGFRYRSPFPAARPVARPPARPPAARPYKPIAYRRFY